MFYCLLVYGQNIIFSSILHTTNRCEAYNACHSKFNSNQSQYFSNLSKSQKNSQYDLFLEVYTY